MPDNIEQIKENINLYDGVILSIDKFSVNARYTVSIDDIKELISLGLDQSKYEANQKYSLAKTKFKMYY